MSKKTFEKIVREVEKDASVKPSSERFFILEKRKKEIRILEKNSFLTSIFGGQLSYYIVANNSDASNLFEGFTKCIVRDFNGDRSIDIIIDYEVSCPPGKEASALYALCSSNLQPEDELESIIKKYVAEYSHSDGNHFIDNYLTERSRLQEVLSYGIQQDTGLFFQLRISLDREKDLQAFEIQPTSFSVRVQDCDDVFDIQLHTQLIVDENNKVRAILKVGREFELANLIKDSVRKFLRENISVRQFYSSLSTNIRDEIFERINSLVFEYGRRIDFLTLTSDAITSAPQQFEEIKPDVDCEIHDPTSISFTISNVLQMELRDIGKFRISQISDLESWAKLKLEPIVKTALFQKKYIEVLLDFDEIAEAIKSRMRIAAEEIGYSIEQIVSTPELAPLKLTKDFDIDIADESFTLKDAKVEIRLNIIPTLHIPNLREIEDDLSPSIDLEKAIRKHIVDVVRRFLNNVEPERFYMRFSAPSVQLGEHTSIEEELSSIIQNALEIRFKAQMSSISIKTLDTEIKLCYERLFERIDSFELEFNSFKDGKPVYLNGDFQINGVDQFSWYTFQARKPTPESIKQCIKKGVHSKLSTLPSEVLSYNNLETQTRLEQIVSQVATDSVIKQFGLLIEVNNVSRKLTQLEELKSGAEQDLERLRIGKIAATAAARQAELDSQLQIVQASSQSSVDELEKLLRKRHQIIDLEDNEEELEELNEKIEKLQANPPSGSIEDAEASLKAMRMKESDANHLLGFSKQIKSLKADDESIGQPSQESNISDADDINQV